MENKNIKTEYPYAVVVRYDFDDDVGVYPCKDEDKAKELLKRFFEAEVAEDEANGHDFESEISDDGWSASITNYLARWVSRPHLVDDRQHLRGGG